MENSVEKLMKRPDKDEYLKYLINLDGSINGSDDDILLCIETTEIYKTMIEKLGKKDLIKKLDDYLSYLDQETEWLLKDIPSKYQKGFNGPEYGLLNIPETDFVMNARIEFERIVTILNKLGITKYKLNKEAQYGAFNK